MEDAPSYDDISILLMTGSSPAGLRKKYIDLGGVEVQDMHAKEKTKNAQALSSVMPFIGAQKLSKPIMQRPR